jgi:hypothetical protein
MLNKFFILPLKTKNRALIIVALLLGYMIYSLALSSTIETFQLNKELLKNTSQAVSQVKLNELKKQHKHIETVLTSSEKDETFLRKKILDLVAHKSELFGVKIVNIPLGHKFKSEDYEAVFNSFEIEGNFVQLNKLLNSLEKESKDARIVSSNFVTKQNRVNKKKELILTIYFQSIIIN